MKILFRLLGLVVLCFLVGSCTPIHVEKEMRIVNRRKTVLPSAALSQSRFGVGGYGSDVSFSPDSSRAVMAGMYGCVVWDIIHSQEVLHLDNHAEWTKSATWSHNGDLIAACAYDFHGEQNNALHIWQSKTGALVRTIHASPGMKQTYAAFSQDDSMVAWTEQNDSTGLRQFHILKMDTGEHAFANATTKGISFFYKEAIAISSDNARGYWLDECYSIRQSPLSVVPLRTYGLPLLVYSPDVQYGYVVAHIYENDTNEHAAQALYKVDLSTGQFVLRYRLPVQPTTMFSMSITRDGRYISLNQNQGAAIIDLEQRSEFGPLVPTVEKYWNQDVNVADFSSDSKSVLGAGIRGVYLWQIP